MPTKIEKDPLRAANTTGHEWDGVKELNTPLPTWWVHTFYATIVFAVVYCALIHRGRGSTPYQGCWAIPAASSSRASWKPRPRHVQCSSTASARRRSRTSRKDPELFNFAMAGGRSAFQRTACSAMAQAAPAARLSQPGRRRLAVGRQLQQIDATIEHGIRNADEKSRQSPAMPCASARQHADAGRRSPPSPTMCSACRARHPDAAEGAKIFEDQCAACHRADKQGNQGMVPNLTDGSGSTAATAIPVYRSIFYAQRQHAGLGRASRPATLKMLAVYVHAPGGGR